MSTGKLFTPVKIGNLTIKNRFMRSPCYMDGCDPDGFPKEWLLEYYKKMADGQMGLIIPGYFNPHTPGRACEGQGSVRSDRHVEAWAKTVEYVHKQGSKIIFQVGDAGIATDFAFTGERPRGPSAVNGARAMTQMEIDEVKQRFKEAAIRIKSIGVDGIQLHAAHGYLLSQFLSPVTNHRTDRYGGSAENRRRLLQEITDEIRSGVGNDFVVGTKINSDDCVPGGVKPADLAETVAQTKGIDFHEVSCGFMSPVWTIRSRGRFLPSDPQYPLHEGYNLDAAAVVRAKNPSMKLGVVGGFRTRAAMEKAVESGVADLISLGRPTIADPEVVRHLMEGAKKVKCVSCGFCIARPDHADRIHCVLNK